jgi:hypothetical protein
MAQLPLDQKVRNFWPVITCGILALETSSEQPWEGT